MKQQIFIDDIHEYDYELTDDNRHILTYEGRDWNSSVLNSEAMSITNNGNGLLIGFDKETTRVHIDYAEAERLFVLLKLAIQPAKYEIAQKKLL